LGRSRAFSLGDSVLELTTAPVASGPSSRGLDFIRIAVRDFSVETATRALRERGVKIDSSAAPGIVRISDPDGLPIELAAT
jgi:hypothetical protein